MFDTFNVNMPVCSRDGMIHFPHNVVQWYDIQFGLTSKIVASLAVAVAAASAKVWVKSMWIFLIK